MAFYVEVIADPAIDFDDFDAWWRAFCSCEEEVDPPDECGCAVVFAEPSKVVLRIHTEDPAYACMAGLDAFTTALETLELGHRPGTILRGQVFTENEDSIFRFEYDLAF